MVRELGNIEPVSYTHLIKAVYGQKEYTVDNTYLSFESTLEAALEEAYQYAREGERDERYALVEALETQPKNFEVKAEFDADEKKEMCIRDRACRFPGPS